VNRRRYLDWLRGIGVLIMIWAHTLDSWTRVEDRGHAYKQAMVIGGFGAPIFLFLAGVSLALAAGSRLRKGLSEREAAERARRRGWQIFGLAFLFRLQSAVISGGWSLQSLLKVDILNIMGLSMLIAAILWGLGRGIGSRILLLSSAAAAVGMLTPIIRETPVLAPLPDAIEWYFRPDPGRTTFTLFPWAGFVLAGSAIGVWLDREAAPTAERRMVLTLGAVGVMVAIAGYLAAFLPPIYAKTEYWTSSPTFFVLRLGLLMVAVALAYLWILWMPRRSRIVEFGVASLFVYWIHVEMVYGVLSLPIHRRLTLVQALIAYMLFSLFLFWLVTLKGRLMARRTGSRPQLHENPAKGV
jgi:uncharacterized membrane protein